MTCNPRPWVPSPPGPRHRPPLSLWLVLGAWALAATPLAEAAAPAKSPVVSHAASRAAWLAVGPTARGVTSTGIARPAPRPEGLVSGAGRFSAQAPGLATQAKAAPKKGKGRSKAKPAPPSGSEESRSERDRRLLRECAGRPNAGACEGYTR